MARTKQKQRQVPRLDLCACVFFYLRLPSDFVTDDLTSPNLATHNSNPEFNNKWTRCFRALQQGQGCHYIKCGRRVEDPADGILFISASSAAALDTLLQSPQWKNCLAALGLRTPPEYFNTVQPIWSYDLDKGRITIVTLSFPYPLTSKQRSSNFGRVPLPEVYYTMSPDSLSGRTSPPKSRQVWVCGPQILPDGRKVQNGLLIQKWQWPWIEDLGAGEELETRRAWMDEKSSHLGLLAITLERYDVYPL